MMAVMTQTPPPQVWPTLIARDARGLIKFLVDAFGFSETAVYGEGDQVHHAELAWPPGGGVMMGSADPGSPYPGTLRTYTVCDDPDTLFKRAVEHGAAVIFEPRDQDYGSREFSVSDPEGNRWSFGTYRGHPR
jgi:uncharacterized glyoxalase superfamily protein PhnB